MTHPIPPKFSFSIAPRKGSAAVASPSQYIRVGTRLENIGREKNFRSGGEDLAGKRKWCPVIGMRVPFAQFAHRALQRYRFIFAFLQSAVKVSHEIRGAPVVYVPERQQKGLRAGEEQSANQ